MSRCVRDLQVVRGSYLGTSDDRIDRWYVVGSGPWDRTGPGFRTRREAEEWIEEIREVRDAGEGRP